MRHINSLTNPTVKALRALHERKYRRQSRLFLAEGMRIVMEAIDLGWVPQHFVFLNGRQDDDLVAKLISAAENMGAECLAVSHDVLAKISRKDNPQAVVASFAEKWMPMDEVIKAQALWVALDRVRDPGNLGTIMRSVDAVGGAGVILIGDCTDGFSVEAVRASMGACFNLSLAEATEEAFLDQVKNWQGEIIGTSLLASSDYRLANWTGPKILLMGNEQAGLTDALAAAATQLIRMPMLGRSDSLNLAVATGVALYEHLRHQHPPE